MWLSAWCFLPAQVDLGYPGARTPAAPPHILHDTNLDFCPPQRKTEKVRTLEVILIEQSTGQQRRPNSLNSSENDERISDWKQISILYVRLQAQLRSGDPSTNFPQSYCCGCIIVRISKSYHGCFLTNKERKKERRWSSLKSSVMVGSKQKITTKLGRISGIPKTHRVLGSTNIFSRIKFEAATPQHVPNRFSLYVLLIKLNLY